jgi:hypothetical protein
VRQVQGTAAYESQWRPRPRWLALCDRDRRPIPVSRHCLSLKLTTDVLDRDVLLMPRRVDVRRSRRFGGRGADLLPSPGPFLAHLPSRATAGMPAPISTQDPAQRYCTRGAWLAATAAAPAMPEIAPHRHDRSDSAAGSRHALNVVGTAAASSTDTASAVAAVAPQTRHHAPSASTQQAMRDFSPGPSCLVPRLKARTVISRSRPG